MFKYRFNDQIFSKMIKNLITNITVDECGKTYIHTNSTTGQKGIHIPESMACSFEINDTFIMELYSDKPEKIEYYNLGYFCTTCSVKNNYLAEYIIVDELLKNIKNYYLIQPITIHSVIKRLSYINIHVIFNLIITMYCETINQIDFQKWFLSEINEIRKKCENLHTDKDHCVYKFKNSFNITSLKETSKHSNKINCKNRFATLKGDDINLAKMYNSITFNSSQFEILEYKLLSLNNDEFPETNIQFNSIFDIKEQSVEYDSIIFENYNDEKCVQFKNDFFEDFTSRCERFIMTSLTNEIKTENIQMD